MRVLFVVPGRQIGTNSAYRSGRGNFWMSAEARVFKERVAIEAKRAMGRQRMTLADCIVTIDYHYDSLRWDVDSPTKLVLDSLQNVVFRNDRQVRALTSRKHLDRDEPRTLIEVATVGAD